MLQIITIATSDYVAHAERLLASLQSSANRWRATVYCDDVAAFSRVLKFGLANESGHPSLGFSINSAILAGVQAPAPC